MSSWEQPQGLRLTTRLREVVAGLREAAPLLADAHVKAFQGMAATVRLAAHPRHLCNAQANDRGECDE